MKLIRRPSQLVHRLQLFHRLQLHDDQVLDQEIDPMAHLESQALVGDRQRPLLPLIDPSQPQLLAQTRPALAARSL